MACGGKNAARGAADRRRRPPPVARRPRPRPPAPPEPVAEPTVVPPEPVRDDSDRVGVARRPQPQLAAEAGVLRLRQQRADARGAGASSTRTPALLKRYATWTVTIEGHCDERGTAEYNLALGERRAVTARAYLVSLGIPADRLRTVSYGKEFPFDPGHDEAAFAKNRRAHFVITAK